jgi:uncharacterized protein with HEPN domain
MSSDDRIYLRHMLDAAAKAVGFAEGRIRADLDDDELLALGLVRLLEVLGEAARQVTPHTKSRFPTIAWRAMTATRNRLIHAYFNVDLDIVWSIVTIDLPPLIAQLEAAIRLLDAE